MILSWKGIRTFGLTKGVLPDTFMYVYALINYFEKGGNEMTKAELIDRIASGAGLSKANASKALDATLNAVKGSLKKGQKVTLVGFGTFGVVKRKSRKGRNPRTGAVITIPAAKTPKFTAGKALKDAIK
jgi:DNA-binding protein HU-beta